MVGGRFDPVEYSSRENYIKISTERENSLLTSIERILDLLPYTTPRKLAKVCGKIISSKIVLGNIVQLRTRRIYYAILDGRTWDSSLSLLKKPGVINELHFWKFCFKKLNLRNLRESYTPVFKIISDASDTGLGAYVDMYGTRHSVYKNFLPIESEQSSTWRELYAIYYSLVSLAPKLKNTNIEWHTDNYAASLIFDKGSRKPELQELSENIFHVCRNMKIQASIRWVPRENIPEADALSRAIDYDDWETTNFLFLHLQKKWGPFTIDRFADTHNSKLPRFNSKYLCPKTEGVNAFLYPWDGENNYIVPPVSLVGKVIRHMSHFKSKGTIVVPYWPSATFWVFIKSRLNEFESFIKDYEIFDDHQNCVTQGKNPKCFIGSQTFQSSILALNVDFT